MLHEIKLHDRNCMNKGVNNDRHCRFVTNNTSKHVCFTE